MVGTDNRIRLKRASYVVLSGDSHSARIALSWKRDGRHFVHLFDELGDEVFLSDLKKQNLLSEQQEVELMGRILTQYRDTHCDPISDFHGAAMHLIQVKEECQKEGEPKEVLVIDNNVQPLDSFNRACAEMRGIHNARGELTRNREELYLSCTYFMGQVIPEDKEPVKLERTMPCGHCREEMIDISDDDSKVYIYPAMSHDDLTEGMPRIKNLKTSEAVGAFLPPGSSETSKEYEVVSIPIMRLLPHKTVRLRDESWVGRIREGVDFIKQDPDKLLTLSLVNKAVSGRKEVFGLKENYTLKNVRNALANEIKDRYHHDGNHPRKIRAVLVRRENGECFVASDVIDEKANSMPPAVVDGMKAAGRAQDIKEVFVMEFDEDHLEKMEELLSKMGAKGAPLELEAFNGSELDRISKRTRDSNDSCVDVCGKKVKGRAILHVLPLSVDPDMTDKDIELGMSSMPLAQFYPLAYKNPKDSSNGTSPAGACGHC